MKTHLLTMSQALTRAMIAQKIEIDGEVVSFFEDV